MPTEFIAQIPFFRPVDRYHDLSLERVLEEITRLSEQLAFPIDGYGSFYPEFVVHNEWPRDVTELDSVSQPHAVLAIRFITELPQEAPGFWSIAVDRDCGSFVTPTLQVRRNCPTFEFLDLTPSKIVNPVSNPFGFQRPAFSQQSKRLADSLRLAL